jgi:hypothetical protein
MSYPRRSITTALLFTLATTTAQAEQPPHEHGAARLQLAALEDQLDIELTTPAYNLIGFEHAPTDDAERRAANTALALLAAPAQLFRLTPAAGCELQRQQVDAGALAEAEAEHHDASTAHHHKHEHEHEHHHDHAEADGAHRHTDLHASYSFRCANLRALAHIDIALFERFPRLERIDAQWLTASGQQARTLRAGDAILPLQ